MSDYSAKVRIKQGGAVLEVDADGVIHLLNGSTMTIDLGATLNFVGGAVIQADGSQAAITALTDNSAGTANNTIQAMADLTDSPASADALRDDIVTNLLPAVRNNIADLAAKVNQLITIIKGVGLAQ